REPWPDAPSACPLGPQRPHRRALRGGAGRGDSSTGRRLPRVRRGRPPVRDRRADPGTQWAFEFVTMARYRPLSWAMARLRVVLVLMAGLASAVPAAADN